MSPIPARPDCPAKVALPCAGAGLALLALALTRAAALSQGSPGARLAVALLLLGLAALAAGLLLWEGVPRRLVLAALLPIGLGLLLRAVCLDHVTYDYTDFLSGWAAFFRDNGGFAAVKLPVGNYNAPYLYFLAAISYLPVPDLYLIKLFSVLFDVLLAWGGLRLVRALCPPGSARPFAAFCLLLLLPTVVLNGAFWAQCDALYGALCLHAMASALGGRHKSAAALLGVAFSFKLQTVFLLPLWGVLWLTRRVKLRELLLFPAAYAATILPALLLGKPLADVLGVYLGQAGEYAGHLTLNAPSAYALIPHGVQVAEAPAAALGIAAAFLLTGAAAVALFLLRGRVDNRVLLTAAVLFTVGIPWLLPYMHERYFFLADLLTLVWACVSLKGLAPALLVGFASTSSYCVYLRLEYTCILTLGGHTYVMLLECLCLLAALVYACCVLVRQLRAPQKPR